MDPDESTTHLASIASFIAAALFTLLLILFGTLPQTIAIPFLGIAFHLLLFPVVAALPSTDWARGAGYGWLILDIASSSMSLYGVDGPIPLTLRLGAHIPAALWIMTTSLRCPAPMRFAGIAQALLMGGYTLVAPWVPVWVLYPAMLLLIVWLILAGRMLARITP